MKNIKKYGFFGYMTILFSMSGCIDGFEIETQGFEGVLVVDARLTDEVKQHQVLLSRARPFEQDTISPLQDAKVSIIENSGITYMFEEVSPGHYVSSSVFSGKPGNTYQLKIITSEGASFSSTTEIMPEKIPFADLEFKRKTNGFGEDGLAVVLKNKSLGNRPRYFRYDYEENYEIRAPNWDPFKFVVVDSIACDGDAYEVGIEAKNSVKGRVCYGKRTSTRIILAATDNLQNNEIDELEVQFVARENYILTHRYSIQVNQYTQSADAHSYYQSLEAFSATESVFSETQPGFLASNLMSETGGEQNVIGYFETAPVSSQRIFVNYEDLFSGEDPPDYPSICSILGNPSLIAPSYHCSNGAFGVCDGNCQSPLIDQIQAKTLVFAGEKEPFDFFAPFLTLPTACGDCTVLGSDIKPDFWID